MEKGYSLILYENRILLQSQNYTNRLRLAYYLLYCHIEDEETVAFLFREELKDRERNSFLSVKSSSARDIIFGYKNLIWHYIHTCDYGKALCLCEKVIKTTDYGQIRTLRLFKDILEACFEVTENHTEAAAGLWNWAKTEL